MINLYFPRIDHAAKRAVIVERHPGETCCARIYSRPLDRVSVPSATRAAQPAVYTRLDRITRRTQSVLEDTARADLGRYYDRPDSLLELLRARLINRIDTRRHRYTFQDAERIK